MSYRNRSRKQKRGSTTSNYKNISKCEVLNKEGCRFDMRLICLQNSCAIFFGGNWTSGTSVFKTTAAAATVLFSQHFKQ